MSRHPGSRWGFGALLKGTSVVGIEAIEGGESAVQTTIPAGPRLEPATFGLRVRLSNHDFPW